MEEIEEETPAEVNKENNLSNRVYEQERRPRPKYGGGERPQYTGKPFRRDRGSYRGGGRR
jgi:hypothetical protein